MVPADVARPQALRLAAGPDRPACALHRLGLASSDRPRACSGSSGPLLVFVIFPMLDIAIGVDPTNPPDSVLKLLEQDRYYR